MGIEQCGLGIDNRLSIKSRVVKAPRREIVCRIVARTCDMTSQAKIDMHLLRKIKGSILEKMVRGKRS